jgi:hypothetical protein
VDTTFALVSQVKYNRCFRHQLLLGR